MLAKFGDLTRKAHERVFDPMPVRVALLPDDSLIVVLGDFPTGRAGAANMKGSDAIGAHLSRPSLDVGTAGSRYR